MSRQYEGWRYAPLRFAVWVLAVVYLGRVQYDNTLWDLKQLTVGRVLVRTTCIGLVLAFVYWNVAIVPPRVAAVLWTGVALMYGAVFALYVVVETGVDYVDAADPLDRRAATRAIDPDEKQSDVVGGYRFGDIADERSD
ncbi:hypothetical protein G9C85_03780 [Halorubellus sp. JP-L1]|uniref:hypothetical protein n=1 Tax=Halorubellus sp. JP-L1 TaxID=2715753 RepID=UPI00140A090C|nr:hypothetical protein [Halorubellus sp. JP-L1]NHN40755.1 hypothetical protein [Halorubellus sp. JP-L1]